MPNKSGTITFDVIADTHLPDRVKALPEGILEKFRESSVNEILHAGDASCWKVVQSLETIAPVRVVQGNRDWLFRMSTPRDITFMVNNIQITLAHGHRSMFHYMGDKWAYITKGYSFERYFKHLSKDYPASDLIIFGHTHYQTAEWVEGKLLFNPGAAYPCKHNEFNPQFGVISITPKGQIRTECHQLY